MSNLPISSKYVSTPDKPVDADERDRVVDRVNAAFEAGAFDDLDYRRFLDLAFSAKTLGELRPVVERLPAQATYATPGNIETASAPPGEVSPARAPSSGLMLFAGAAVGLAVVVLIVLLVVIL